jgi:hypothetical protein
MKTQDFDQTTKKQLHSFFVGSITFGESFLLSSVVVRVFLLWVFHHHDGFFLLSLFYFFLAPCILVVFVYLCDINIFFLSRKRWAMMYTSDVLGHLLDRVYVRCKWFQHSDSTNWECSCYCFHVSTKQRISTIIWEEKAKSFCNGKLHCGQARHSLLPWRKPRVLPRHDGSGVQGCRSSPWRHRYGAWISISCTNSASSLRENPALFSIKREAAVTSFPP